MSLPTVVGRKLVIRYGIKKDEKKLTYHMYHSKSTSIFQRASRSTLVL